MTHDLRHDAEMDAIVAELEAAASRRMTAQDGPGVGPAQVITGVPRGASSGDHYQAAEAAR